MLQLYNTLTHKIEEFKPIDPPNVGFYSCGPTVYDFAHIGHARTYIFSDILERVLKYNGFQVKRVMNITDVGHLTSDSDSGEDKMELASRRSGKDIKGENKTVWDIAKYYTDDFFRMCESLEIKKPEIICKATDYIPQMIDLIKILEKKGFTYRIPDGIYFDTSKFPQYGKLTGQNFDKLQQSLKAGARVEISEGKKHPTDFAMWKLTPPDVKRQMEWDSPWGKGFPGWHIECSTMSMKNLGETIDIHTGGVDHIPIHHTNEIAQSEAATGKQFVKYWLHADHLLVEGEKMSKSLGNFFRLKDIEEKGYSPLALRYLFLTSSYKTAMNFTWKSLEGAQTAFGSLKSQIQNLPASAGSRLRRDKSQISKKERVNLSEEKLAKIDGFRNRFYEAIDDDLNTAKALGIVWEVVKSNIPSGDKYDLLMTFDEVLGLDLGDSKLKDKNVTASAGSRPDDGKKLEIPEDIKKLAMERERLRKVKKFEEADGIRKKIEDQGFLIEDTAEGMLISKK